MREESLQAEKLHVPAEFDVVAKRYDLLTGMNPGYKKHLAWSATRMGLAPRARVLDLCCGTGLSTEALRSTYPDATLVGLDQSRAMLDVAAKKRSLAQVQLVCGDATDPAGAGVEGPFDGVLMAYGIRNVPDADRCLANIFALLAPGGVACFHEYSVRDSRRSQLVWNAVSMAIIIPSGLLTSPRSGIYRYLRRSVNAFDGVLDFEARLIRAGFVGVKSDTMDGWQKGIVHSFIARRPGTAKKA